MDRGVFGAAWEADGDTLVSFVKLSTQPNFFPYKQDENFLLHDFNQQPPVHFLLITLSSQDKRDSKALDSRKSTSDPFTGADREQGTAFRLLTV